MHCIVTIVAPPSLSPLFVPRKEAKHHRGSRDVWKREEAKR